MRNWPTNFSIAEWTVVTKKGGWWDDAQLVKKRAEEIWLELKKLRFEKAAASKLQAWWRSLRCKTVQLDETPLPKFEREKEKLTKSEKRKAAAKKQLDDDRILAEVTARADEERRIAELQHAAVLRKP